MMMYFFKHIWLFMKNNVKHLWRKWYSLPLLLFFPIFMIASILVIFIAYFSPGEEEAIRVGLVDMDQSEETQLVVQLIEESSQLGSFIQLESMDENKAKRAIDANQLSAYIAFPDGFTADLYKGTSLALPLIGNPKKPTESHVIKELLDSVTRHIRYSQANILTINTYLKQLPIGNEERNDMLFEEFKQFFFYALGKDKIIKEQEVDNQATSQTKNYYGISLWFTITTIWLFVIYQFFIQEESQRMTQRMKLYGVTLLQQYIARILITLIVSAFFSILLFIGVNKLLQWNLYIEDYRRIFLISVLYSSLFLLILSSIQTIMSDRRLGLFIQSTFTIGTLILSGAVIPVIYFPLQLQSYLPYLFTHNAFHWLIEIIINERFYADYVPLFSMNILLALLLIGLSVWKERVRL